MINPLKERFASLKLKGKPFRSLQSPSADALSSFGEKILDIDPLIDIGKLTKLGLKVNVSLHAFIKSHCDVNTYCFTFTKCSDRTCSQSGPPILPLEKFESVVTKMFPLPVLSKERPRHFCSLKECYRTVPDPSSQPSLGPRSDGIVHTKQPALHLGSA